MGVALDTGVPRPQEQGVKKITYDTETDMATITLPASQVQKAQEAISFMDNSIVEMQKEADRIAAREQQARGRNPVLAALSAVASHLGSQPDMPGFVRGLAGANREMNPDPDVLAMQKLPIYMQVAKLAEDRARLGMQQQQITQQGETNSIYKEQMAQAAAMNAETNVQKALTEQSKTMPLTEAQVRSRLGPKADPEIVRAWVLQSRNIWEENKRQTDAEVARLESQRLSNRATARSLDEGADLKRSQAEYNRARAALVPLLGAARIGELDARAQQHLSNGTKNLADIARDTNRFLLDKQKFDQAKSDKDMKNFGDLILANPMAPESALKEARELMAKRKIIPDFVPVQPQAGPTVGPGPAQPQPTYLKDATGKLTHQLSPDGKSWVPLK